MTLAFLDSIMPHLDLCDTDSMKLVDDLSGHVLTKQIDVSNPVAHEGSGLDSMSAGQPNQVSSAPTLLCRLLRVFDAVCEEFGLTYIATHGTLLGAVRHGGFVPGDHDLDVAMPRSDYDTLCWLADEGVFPWPFHLQTPENDPEHFYGGYAKLRDLSPETLEYGDDWHCPDGGIKIDIMPLDDCPRGDEERYEMRHHVRRWQRMLYAKVMPWDASKLSDVSPRRLSAYYILSKKMNHQLLCKGLRAACMTCKHTGLLTVFAGNYNLRGNALLLEHDDIANAVRVPFADATIPIPRHAEEWLVAYYGENWKSVPDGSEQVKAE